jgi:N-sulfoglucosamine sulfohydrolase
MRATRLWIVLLGLAVGQAAAAGKNIVLFVADDHGRDAGCYGNPVIQTPNLDRLAAEGLRFDYAFCTTASCSASRSVILTGLHNHANGQYGHEHHWHKFSSHRWVQSLPMLLSKAGYRTARAGKFHVAPEEAYPFDEVLKADGRNPVALADAARPFIAAASDKPFFLYICTLDPHRRGGPAHELPYMPDRFGNPAPGQSHAGVKEVIYDPQNVIVPPFLPDSPECRAELAQYYQSVSRVDQGIGRLVKHLKEARVYDDTLFIYISDNGSRMPGS